MYGILRGSFKKQDVPLEEIEHFVYNIDIKVNMEKEVIRWFMKKKCAVM
jgi:hypothetical protein